MCTSPRVRTPRAASAHPRHHHPTPSPKDNTHFEGRTRHHRQVPAKLRAAVNAFLHAHAASPAANNAAGGAAGGPLAALLHLGDMIDGYPGHPDGAALSRRDLGLVLAELGRVEAAGPRVFHTLGNHDLAVPRAELAAALQLPEGSSGYYAAPLAEGWRLVVLDTTDISLYGRGQVRAGAGARSGAACGPEWEKRGARRPPVARRRRVQLVAGGRVHGQRPASQSQMHSLTAAART